MNHFIKHNIDHDGICTVSINRKPVNALSYDLLEELYDLIIKLNDDSRIRFLILQSSISHFSAGADLKERKIMSLSDSNSALDNFNNCFNAIEEFKYPTLCIINGYCLGGGAELALACDLRIGSKDSIIGFPEVSIGIIPGAGGTYRLPRVIGYSNSKYWILSAKKFDAKSALKYGFLNFVFTNKLIVSEARKIALNILENAPIAISAAKRSINSNYNKSLNEGLKIERDCYTTALNSDDRNEALDAFINKRKPKWQNK